MLLSNYKKKPPINLFSYVRFFVSKTTEFLFANFGKEIAQMESVLREGVKERFLIEKEMSAVLSEKTPITLSEFKKKWSMTLTQLESSKVYQFDLDLTHLLRIRRIIEDYPTIFFKLTATLELNAISTKSKDLTVLSSYVLIEHYNVKMLNHVFVSFGAVSQYYQFRFSLLLKTDSKNFKHNLGFFTDIFASSTFFLKYLKTQINGQIQKTPSNLNHVKYNFTSSFFLTQSLTKLYDGGRPYPLYLSDQFSYFNLPSEFTSYLAKSEYRAFTYKKDLMDLVFQFLKLNNMVEPPSYFQSFKLSTLFKQFLKHKTLYLQQWSKDYSLPEETFVFCLNSFLMGKNEITFLPLRWILDYEQQNLNIRSPTFGTILTAIKSSLLTLIYSFYYRQCTFIQELNAVLLRRTNNNIEVEAKTRISESLNMIIARDIICMESETKNNVLENLGAYSYREAPERANFAFLLHAIEKQISAVIFHKLIDLIPKLVVNSEKNVYNIALSGTDPNWFMIPKSQLDSVDMEKLFSLLSNEIKTSIGYDIQLEEIDLFKHSKDLENFLKNFKNEDDFFTQIVDEIYPFKISNNSFLETEDKSTNNARLLLMELELLIKHLFPNFSNTEIALFQKKIINVFEQRGFQKKQFRIDLDYSHKLYFKRFNKNQESFSTDNRAYGFAGLRLKKAIFDELFPIEK